MRTKFCSVFAAVGLTALPMAGVSGQDLKEIRISSQPGAMGTVPFLVANEKGWWKEVGLKATVIEFPAGAPQVAAARSWDVGYTGSVPAVLGAVRFGLETIAVGDDGSDVNALYVAGPTAEAVIKDPRLLKGTTIFLTANSTVDLVARSCLQKFGVARTDVTMRSMGQAEIIAAMSSGGAAVGGLWAPNIYTVEEKAGARRLCSGKDAGLMVTGNLVARAEWAKENPQLVARFLAVYLRAQRWLAANPGEAMAALKRHYDAGGVVLSEVSMKRELTVRPTFDLAGQLAVFSRTDGLSSADKMMNVIAGFMKEVGSLRADEPLPDPKSYVTDAYLKLVDADPQLKVFANRGN